MRPRTHTTALVPATASRRALARCLGLGLLLGACGLPLAGCQAELAPRTPPQARLPEPVPDDPFVTDPGATGILPRRRETSPRETGTPGGIVPPTGTVPSDAEARQPRAEPGGPRLADRPSEWPPGGVAAGEGMPPIPPPPTWDPTLDTRVRVPADGPRPGRSPAGTTETPPAGMGPADAPRRPRGPTPDGPTEAAPTGALPPAGGADAPAAPGRTTPLPERPLPERPLPADPALPAEPARAPAPAASSDDLGAPPGGALPSPMGPTPAVPAQPAPSEPAPVEPAPSEPAPSEPAPSEPAPSEPAPSEPAPIEPAPIEPAPVEPAPVEPAPIEPAPVEPAPAGDDPWVPGGTPPTQPTPVEPAPVEPAPAAPAADDPWVPGGAPAAPTPAEPTPAEPGPVEPGPVEPAPAKPAPGDDPWLPGGAPAAGPETEPTPSDAPPAADDPWVPGGAPAAPTPAEPTAPVPAEAGAMARAMAHVTRLLDDPGSAAVVGYPADLVRPAAPAVAQEPGTRPVLIVFHDDRMRASDLQAAQLLPLIVRNRDRIDVVTIDRGPDAARTSIGDQLTMRFLDHVPTTVVLDAQRTTRLLRSGRVDGAVVQRAIDDAIANPTPAPADTQPPPDEPVPGTSPAVPPSPGATPGPADEPADPERTGLSFTPPGDFSARTHAERLRTAPGDAKVPGYPRDLLPDVPAGRVLGPGAKPCVILFYDDASKASDLQAAAFLELLVRRGADIDLVLVDVGTKASWSEDEKRVVRTYYNFYVPTTVVLTAARAPVKSWYSRVAADALEAAIDEALGR